jgi:UDP-glucose:(heptosyl)LPS alpha-1,3-glucosyltransferase
MKILLTIDHFHPGKGGAERSLARILSALRDRGHEVGICAIGGECPPGVDWRFHRVGAPRWPGWLRHWWFAERVVARVRSLAPDRVLGVRHVVKADVFLARGGLHCETLAANRRVRPAPPFDRFRSMQPKHQVMLALERRLLSGQAAPRVVAPSEMVRRQCLERFALRTERVVVVPTGIDLQAYRPAREAARRELRVALGVGERVTGLFVAHNFALKGLPCLLQAWGNVDPERFHLLIAGRGRPPAVARSMRHVTFLGERQDVRTLYHAADFLVHPTFYDPFSRVVIEGLACGLPVITTRRNGAAEVMEDGREGYVLEEPTQIERLTSSIARLGIAEVREDLGRAARVTAERYPERDFLVRTAEEIELAGLFHGPSSNLQGEQGA